MHRILTILLLTLTSGFGATPTSAVPPRLNGLQVNSEFDARWWGATGNGSTDDALAINAALTYVNSIGGGVVRLAPGTNAVGSSITVPAGVTLKGSGRNTTIIKETAILSPVVAASGDYGGVSDLWIKGLETALTWNITNTVTQSRCGVTATANFVTVRNVRVSDKSTGIKGDDGITNFAVLDCETSNSWLSTGLANYFYSSGVFLEGTIKSRVQNCSFTGGGQAILSGHASQIAAIKDNFLEGMQDNGIYISSGNNFTISGNVTTNLIGSGIKARGSWHIVTGNVVDKCTVGVGIAITTDDAVPSDPDELKYSILRGLPSGSSATNIFYNGYNGIIANNTVRNCNNGGIRFDRTTEAVEQGTYYHSGLIENNTLFKCAQTVGSASAIKIFGSDIIIAGNTVVGWATDAGNYGFLASSPTNIVYHNIIIRNNFFDSLTNAPFAVELTGVTNAVVEGNIIGGATNSLVLSLDNNVKVRNNVFKSIDGIANTGRLRLSDANTNLYVWSNDSDSIVSAAVAPVNSLFGMNRPVNTGRELISMGNANSTVSIGLDASPGTTDSNPITIQRDTNDFVQVRVINRAALGSTAAFAGYSAFVGAIGNTNDAAFSVGVYPADSSTARYRKRAVLSAGSVSTNGVLIDAQNTGMSVDLAADGGVVGARLSGMVWRTLGGVSPKRTATAANPYTILTNDYYIVSTASSTKNLPAANTTFDGQKFELFSKSGTLTVGRTGGDTINGVAADDALAAGIGATYISDGSSNYEVSKPPGYMFALNMGVSFNPADATTYYIGGDPGSPRGAYTNASVRVPKTGIIKNIYVKVNITGTLGTTETVAHNIRINDATDVSIGNLTYDVAVKDISTDVTQVVSAGDWITLKVGPTTWSTNPTAVRWWCTVYIE